MKMRNLLYCGLLLLASIVMPTNASCGGCPAFNSAMVDAAMLATDYSQAEPVIGEAMDKPAEPRIYCEFVNDDDGLFLISVDYDSELEPPDYYAYLLGLSPAHGDPKFATRMRTLVLNLSDAEARACRAQVLASFTWNQYCRPLIQ